MDYANSICFCENVAETLNSKAFLLNKSLFLFAYYEPKEFPSSESKKSRFGLAPKDCPEGPLPGGVFFRILASDVDQFVATPTLGYRSS